MPLFSAYFSRSTCLPAIIIFVLKTLVFRCGYLYGRQARIYLEIKSIARALENILKSNGVSKVNKCGKTAFKTNKPMYG